MPSPWRASPHTIAIQSAIYTVNLTVQRMANENVRLQAENKELRAYLRDIADPTLVTTIDGLRRVATAALASNARVLLTQKGT